VTPIWYADTYQTPETTGYFRFHTGAPIADTPGSAAFALLDGPAAIQSFGAFAIGTPDYPDRSTTLIIEVGALTGQGAVLLSGPGLAQPTPFGVDGVDEALWPLLVDNHALFPLGIDVIFTAGDKVAALPRSSRIEV
jgi:alpha-D-ribose 1-methylphosphonate 5-triphosphate synthase subunit PhnH